MNKFEYFQLKTKEQIFCEIHQCLEYEIFINYIGLKNVQLIGFLSIKL